MASMASKILRHHVRLIRFKYGANQSGMTDASTGGTSDSNTAKSIGASSSSSSKAGQKSAPLEFSQTPKKYRRRPLTQDEIDLVTVNKYIFIYLNILFFFVFFRLVDLPNHNPFYKAHIS
jgi:hypothetical protein